MRTPSKGPRKRQQTITWSKLLTADEERQLMVYLRKGATDVPGRRLFLICDILLNTGLRIGELAKLRVQDTPAVLGVDVIEVYLGKGKKDRTIPVHPRLNKAIADYVKQTRPRTLPRHIRRADLTRPVFYSSSKRPYLQRVSAGSRPRVTVSLYRSIRSAGQAAGIDKVIHPHMFRHTYAVHALMKTSDNDAVIDIYTLQQLMGHSSIETTAKYLHFVRAQDANIGIKLDRDYGDYL